MKRSLVYRFKVLTVVVLGAISSFGYAQTTIQNYNASGTIVFGAGVTNVNVSMWGGGGGGSAGGCISYSGALNEIQTYYNGAGGGGSNWTGGNVTVVPGTSYNFIVGSGGAAGGFSGSTPLAGKDSRDCG